MRALVGVLVVSMACGWGQPKGGIRTGPPIATKPVHDWSTVGAPEAWTAAVRGQEQHRLPVQSPRQRWVQGSGRLHPPRVLLWQGLGLAATGEVVLEQQLVASDQGSV